jgi:hypothetical protein
MIYHVFLSGMSDPEAITYLFEPVCICLEILRDLFGNISEVFFEYIFIVLLNIWDCVIPAVSRFPLEKTGFPAGQACRTVTFLLTSIACGEYFRDKLS